MIEHAVPVTILVGDDDAGDRRLTQKAFDRSKLMIDLRFVEDGVELLDYLYRRGRYADSSLSPRPGIIILDLKMPKKDGHETLQAIKADPDLDTIPVVVLTTSKREEDIYRSYKFGASSFVTKPVSFEGLVEVVQALGNYWLRVVDLPPAPRGA